MRSAFVRFFERKKQLPLRQSIGFSSGDGVSGRYLGSMAIKKKQRMRKFTYYRWGKANGIEVDRRAWRR